mmetsp:Transcript_8811/g.8882  ORF Transcript_8811/g.8882 Transcript_8811/m.8882 type:complete len:283 (-) Transcript_8811:412-1260(-)
MSIPKEENARILGRVGGHGNYSSASSNGYDNAEANNGSGTGRRGQLENEQSVIRSYLKSIIFGGIDGVLISISIISAAEGGDFTWRVVLCIGLSCVLANALHYGIGEYLSSKAHRDFVNTEKRREKWEFKNFKEGEVTEMINIFEEKGMSRPDAELVVRKISEYDNFFVNMMITEELGLQIPDEDDAALLKDSIVMFLSFTIFGCLPFMIYFTGPWQLVEPTMMFIVSITMAAVILFLLGVAKSSFSSVFWFYGGIESLIMGVIHTGTAYGFGSLLCMMLQS